MTAYESSRTPYDISTILRPGKAFLAGRTARFWHHGVIPGLGQQTIKLILPLNTLFTGYSVTVLNGFVQADVLFGASDATSFTVPITITPTNNLVGKEPYAFATTAYTGGTATGGVVVDRILSRTSSNTNTSSVTTSATEVIGSQPTTSYTVFKNRLTSPVEFMCRVSFEEYPI